jgi:hypothetical protein
MSKLTRRQFVKTLSFGAAAGVASAAYTGDCSNWLSLERSELKLPKWNADGYKVALVADLHTNSLSQMIRARKAISLALAEKPDLFIIAGDFINYSTPTILDFIPKTLEPLNDAHCPCLAVLGNHDYACPRPDLIIERLKHSPVKLLRNEIYEADGVSVVGVDDATEGLEDYTFFPEDQVSKNCLVVLHEPDFVRHMPSHGSIQISGHTHGGQICLPFGYAMHTPLGGKKYISGWFPNAQIPLYVTRGVGTVGLDVRLFCRPEISILTLRSA